MNTLIFIMIFTPNNFQYGYLGHLHGYYTVTEEGYSFKHCYKDEVRTVIQKDDIKLVIDYLEEKHDTKLKFYKLQSAELYESVFRKDGVFYQLDLIAISDDGINYIIEVIYRRLEG